MSIVGYRGRPQLDYSLTNIVGLPGLAVQIIKSTTFSSIADDVAQMSIVGVGFDPAEPGASFEVIVNGISSGVVTAVAGDTPTTIAAALVERLEDNGANANVAISVQAGNITLTGRFPGQSFTITGSADNDGMLTVDTPTAASVTNPLPAGLVAARKSTDPDGSIRLPSAGSDVLIGVVASTYNREEDITSALVYRRGDSVSVLEAGTVWVIVEAPVLRDDIPRYRFEAAGDLTQLGAFSGSSGAGKAGLGSSRFETNSVALPEFGGILIARLVINRP